MIKMTGLIVSRKNLNLQLPYLNIKFFDRLMLKSINLLCKSLEKQKIVLIKLYFLYFLHLSTVFIVIFIIKSLLVEESV